MKTFPNGLALNADATDPATVAAIVGVTGRVPLVVADPPYGKIVGEDWDRFKDWSQHQFVEWMLYWTRLWREALTDGGTMYVWGGLGKPTFRPFLAYLARVEVETELTLHNVITWGKKRAYGVQDNYLYTREECAMLVRGHKPATFNVPLLDEKRGYAGYDPNYPAKSEYKRRTNVWTDITEILRGKIHPTQKPDRLFEILIETSSNPGDVVIDPFAGSGTTARAVTAKGRRFCVIESDAAIYRTMCEAI